MNKINKPPRLTEEEYNALSKAEKEAVDKQREIWADYLASETKQSKFERIARPRLAVVFGNLNNLQKMVKSPAYSVTYEVVNNMCEQLHNKIDAIKEAYQPTSKEEISNQVVESIFTTSEEESTDGD